MWLLAFIQEHGGKAVEHAGKAAEHAAEAGKAAEHGAEHAHPWLVEQVYHLTGLNDHSLPPSLIFAIISFFLCIIILRAMVGRLSVDKPSYAQQMIEIVVLQVKGMIEQGIGSYGFKYMSYLLPLAFFILISNLMGLCPLFEPPTNSFSVTLPLGVMTFLYYMFMGFWQQGFGYLKHFMGGLDKGFLALIGVLIFVVEVFSNCLRPLTLGFRLMINLFADEKVAEGFGQMLSIVLPSVLMVLAAFVCFVQTFVFIQLAIVYLAETIPHHDHEEGHDHDHGHGDEAHAH
ncbi:MAG: F0F1 ATP synthase subunit A [Blastocatellia bacterium]|nr:F0F1 ATP synthase subunit A [Blastocatellia bacterium]